MSAATARSVLAMMRDTVLRGTGHNAVAPGYETAGKTGTAEKPGPDGYDPDRNVTSFAAVFPASRPQFVVLVVLDEAQPRTGDARTAAYTAASIAGRVIARAAPLLDVEPVLGDAAPSAAAVQPGPGAVADARTL
jgi:cell division protein FtsI (penicillin-binding protein 3)